MVHWAVRVESGWRRSFDPAWHHAGPPDETRLPPSCEGREPGQPTSGLQWLAVGGQGSSGACSSGAATGVSVNVIAPLLPALSVTVPSTRYV